MRKSLGLLLVFISLAFQVKAQDDFDPDELLLKARTLIFDGSYTEGRKLAFKALGKYPEYADILILVGRSYAWEGKNDSASIYLERAIIASPTYEDGYSAYLDNLIWADQYDKANEALKKAKSNFEGSLPQGLRYKESRLLYYQEEYDKAYSIVEELFDQGFKQEGLLGYMQNLQRLRRTNAIGTTYDYDTFQGDISPWHTWSVYGRTRTNLTGSLIARITQSSRFDGFGTLYELDAYPSLGENSYAYLNLGGSSASFFPKLRLGASVYFNLPKAWEIDGGYRYLGFSEITNIITGSLGKYVGNWWLNMRLNVIPSSGGTSSSAIFQSRYYFKTGEDFLSIQLSSGVSPDEENRDLSQLLNSYRVRLGYQQLVLPRLMIYGYSGFSKIELSADRFRNNINISFGTEYRF